MTSMEAARAAQEYDECEHGVPGSAECSECARRRHADEIQALNKELDRLTQAINSALCMLCEGTDVVGRRQANLNAQSILYAALHPDAPLLNLLG